MSLNDSTSRTRRSLHISFSFSLSFFSFSIDDRVVATLKRRLQISRRYTSSVFLSIKHTFDETKRGTFHVNERIRSGTEISIRGLVESKIINRAVVRSTLEKRASETSVHSYGFNTGRGSKKGLDRATILPVTNRCPVLSCFSMEKKHDKDELRKRRLYESQLERAISFGMYSSIGDSDSSSSSSNSNSRNKRNIL